MDVRLASAAPGGCVSSRSPAAAPSGCGGPEAAAGVSRPAARKRRVGVMVHLASIAPNKRGRVLERNHRPLPMPEARTQQARYQLGTGEVYSVASRETGTRNAHDPKSAHSPTLPALLPCLPVLGHPHARLGNTNTQTIGKIQNFAMPPGLTSRHGSHRLCLKSEAATGISAAPQSCWCI